MIHATLTMIYAIFYGCTLLVFLFLLLCMNVFTVPVFLLLSLACFLFRRPRPKMRLYGLMVYPSWRSSPRFTLSNTIARRSRQRSQASKRGFRVTAPWEARFFK